MTSMQDELARTDEQAKSGGWASAGRLLLKAALLFVILNLLFAATFPLDALGTLSLYNFALPGRQRLPYGENPAESYNVTLNNLPAMFASQTVAEAKSADEYRVLIIGDSGSWGWLLENKDTLAGQINQRELETQDGRQVVAYNLAYPVLSVTKDLLLMDEAMAYEPDLIVWPVTLDSLAPEKQLDHPLVQNNAGQVRQLIAEHNLALDGNDARFVEPSFLERTIVGQRRPLADMLRLQVYGFSWAATGIDQQIPADFPLRKSDFEEDVSWQGYEKPVDLGVSDLSFDVLAAGMTTAGDVPVILINEPIFVSDGENSHLRYNSFYPRWAYDQYRQLLAGEAAREAWTYLDLWDSVPAYEFTDTPVHLTPAGVTLVVEDVIGAILDGAN